MIYSQDKLKSSDTSWEPKSLIRQKLLDGSRNLRITNVQTSCELETPKWDSSKIYGLVDINSQPNHLARCYSSEDPK